MDKNKRSAQTDTGAVDINDIHKRKMIKAFTGRGYAKRIFEFSDMPGGFGLPMKEAKEKVKKLELQQEARKARRNEAGEPVGMKKGGSVKSSASKRADGIAIRGKTKGRMV
jgi:hypothetical protein